MYASGSSLTLHLNQLIEKDELVSFAALTFDLCSHAPLRLLVARPEETLVSFCVVYAAFLPADAR